jgi:hypothetical protein
MNNVGPLIWIALLLPAAVFLALPRLTPPGYFLGITVPPDFPQTESGRQIGRGYMLTVSGHSCWGWRSGLLFRKRCRPRCFYQSSLARARSSMRVIT